MVLPQIERRVPHLGAGGGGAMIFRFNLDFALAVANGLAEIVSDDESGLKLRSA